MTKRPFIIATLSFLLFVPAAQAIPCANPDNSECASRGQVCNLTGIGRPLANPNEPASTCVTPVTGAPSASSPVVSSPPSASSPVITSPPSASSPVFTNPNYGKTTLVNPLGANTTLMSLLQRILDFVIQIGAIIVVLMLVYVGYKFVVAQGEPGKLSEAREMLLWTVIGALILLGAKVIATGIEATVNALMVGK